MTAAGIREKSWPLRVSSPLSRVSLSERQLADLWEGQRFPAEALLTRRGERLRVIYRGRRQAGPGPDFRDAVIASPACLLKGDVELHLRASDFRRHGHQGDPAFDNVVLHLVFWDDEGADTLLACGRRVPVVALAPWLARRTEEIRAWLAGPPLWEEPCRSALARLGPQEVARALDRLGDMRFRQKVFALARELEQGEGEEVLYRRLLEALGYGQNRGPFLALATALPWRQLRASLLGLPPRRRVAAAERLLLAASVGLPWRTRGLRPANRPPQRLAGAARLAARYAQAGLLGGLMAAVGRGEFRDALVVKEGGLSLIGEARAGEMAVNVVLPFAVACGDPPLAAGAQALYRRWRRPATYGVTGHLDRALRVGQDDGVAIDARRQQGMLYLYQTYCRRGGCGRCPLS